MIESITQVAGMKRVRKWAALSRELLPKEAASITPLGVDAVYCLTSYHEAVHEEIHMNNLYTIIQTAYKLGVLAGRQEEKKGR